MKLKPAASQGRRLFGAGGLAATENRAIQQTLRELDRARNWQQVRERLVVLVMKRNGIPRARSVGTSRVAPGRGASPEYRVPSRSQRMPAGRTAGAQYRPRYRSISQRLT